MFIVVVFDNKRGIFYMKLTIIRIDGRVVTCELEGGTLIDIARRWFTEDIQDGDVIEFDVNEHKQKLIKSKI